MAWKVSWNKKTSISRVITKVVVTLLALYVGGTLWDNIGDIMLNKESGLYAGLGLVGYTVGAYPTNGTHWATTCAGTTYTSATSVGANCITSVTASSGILAVIGIVGLASVVMEFVVLKAG